MRQYKLEEVFNEAAFPAVTFAPPKEYAHLQSSFRSEGKHITITGPSGTGKTTLVKRMLGDLGVPRSDVLWINGRQYAGINSAYGVLGKALGEEPKYEAVTPLLQLVQFVIIDDFHHMADKARKYFASNLKLWHEEGVRFIIIGIAASGPELYGEDPELGIRNDPYELKTQDETFIREIIRLGSEALNVDFSDALQKEIVDACNGVPSIAQVICKNCCIQTKVEGTQAGEPVVVDFELKSLREEVLRVFRGKYFDKVVGLAKGKQQARSVHNTYFDIVSIIASEDATEIPVELLYRKIVSPIDDSKERTRKATSFNNCLNNLSDVIQQRGLGDMIVHNKGGDFISIEDPSFRFYLNLLDMSDVRKRIHLRTDKYPYDVAVSFAGEMRSQVESFCNELKLRGISVFYDFDQQAQLWGQDLRTKLANVYAYEALFMVVFLSEAYPASNWPDFELAIGQEAASKRTEEYLLPVLCDDVKVVGLKSTIAHQDLRQKSVSDLADLVAEKVQSAAIDFKLKTAIRKG
jgi:energy-coupling factor transporter ATP-binding protein EcfA2